MLQDYPIVNIILSVMKKFWNKLIWNKIRYELNSLTKYVVMLIAVFQMPKRCAQASVLEVSLRKIMRAKWIIKLFLQLIGDKVTYLWNSYLGNNTEKGTWYHTPDKGTTIVISHPLPNSTFTCFVNQVNRSFFLHISEPVHRFLPNAIRYFKT